MRRGMAPTRSRTPSFVRSGWSAGILYCLPRSGLEWEGPEETATILKLPGIAGIDIEEDIEGDEASVQSAADQIDTGTGNWGRCPEKRAATSVRIIEPGSCDSTARVLCGSTTPTESCWIQTAINTALSRRSAGFPSDPSLKPSDEQTYSASRPAVAGTLLGSLFPGIVSLILSGIRLSKAALGRVRAVDGTSN